jgi:uncharacterized Zn-binding protein involved in type VI secretion
MNAFSKFITYVKNISFMTLLSIAISSAAYGFTSRQPIELPRASSLKAVLPAPSLTDLDLDSLKGEISLLASKSYKIASANPSAVAVSDALKGIPVTLKTNAAVSGSEVFVNGIKAAVTGDEIGSVTFILAGEYAVGPLTVKVNLPNGDTAVSQSVLSIKKDPLLNQKITLGDGHAIIAESVDVINSYTLKLSGNIALNDFLHASSVVELTSSKAIALGDGEISIQKGTLRGDSYAYAIFSKPQTDNANYGQRVLSGKNVPIFRGFNFDFDEKEIKYAGSEYTFNGKSLDLPGFGIFTSIKSFNGHEVEFRSNKVYGIPHRPQLGIDQIFGSVDYNNINVFVKKDYMRVYGDATITSNTSMVDMDGEFTLDTDRIGNEFDFSSGSITLTELAPFLGPQKTVPIRMAIDNYWLDSVKLNAPGFSVDVSGLSENRKDKQPLEISATFHLSDLLDEEPYTDVLTALFPTEFDCDRILKVDNSLWPSSGLKAYHSSDPETYISLEPPYGDDSYNDLIIGQATLHTNLNEDATVLGITQNGSSRAEAHFLRVTGKKSVESGLLDLTINVYGHIEVPFYGIKFDGVSKLMATHSGIEASPWFVQLTYGMNRLEYFANSAGEIVGAPFVKAVAK